MEHHAGPPIWLAHIPFLPHEHKLLHINGALVVFLCILVVSLIFNLLIRKAKVQSYIIPESKFSLISMVDTFMEALYGLILPVVGEHGRKYVPFIASLFIFILSCNLLGLLPFSEAPTSNLNTTIGLGLAAFLYYNALGIKEQGLVNYLKHFLMGLGPAGILIAFLEIFSHCIRPVSLGLRLFVNMFVDHAVLMSFSELVAWFLPIPLLLFGMVICTIQAFVFSVLTAVYVQMAIEHDH